MNFYWTELDARRRFHLTAERLRTLNSEVQMSQPKKSSDRPRQVWRITPDVPLGEVVDPDSRFASGPERSSADDGLDAGWLGSSWDLLNGLEVTETDPGGFDDLFSVGAPSASANKSPTSEPPVSKHQWILRFALKFAELDPHAEPKRVLALARRLWPAMDPSAPEAAALAEYDQDRKGQG